MIKNEKMSSLPEWVNWPEWASLPKRVCMLKNGLAYRNGGDHHDFLEVVLEDEAHVEVLELELDPLEVDELHVFQRDHHRRLEQRGQVGLRLAFT
jgi:hypothetical protein